MPALGLFFWGGKNNYQGKFDSRLRQNIMMACYCSKQSEEQIVRELCESGWLIPMKGGMSATTVMYLY